MPCGNPLISCINSRRPLLAVKRAALQKLSSEGERLQDAPDLTCQNLPVVGVRQWHDIGLGLHP
jgi:hypothetical protein